MFLLTYKSANLEQLWAIKKKNTVEGHKKASRIGYNLDAWFSVGLEKKCSFIGGWC